MTNNFRGIFPHWQPVAHPDVWADRNQQDQDRDRVQSAILFAPRFNPN
ncbi:hypothetical protein [Trichothermofontia sp.]